MHLLLVLAWSGLAWPTANALARLPPKTRRRKFGVHCLFHRLFLFSPDKAEMLLPLLLMSTCSLSFNSDHCALRFRLLPWRGAFYVEKLLTTRSFFLVLSQWVLLRQPRRDERAVHSSSFNDSCPRASAPDSECRLCGGMLAGCAVRRLRFLDDRRRCEDSYRWYGVCQDR